MRDCRARALLGYYTPHKIEYDAEGRRTRVPDGEEIPSYYPSVITERLFNEVGAKAYLHSTPLRGRQGEGLTNLFTGLVFCHWCGASMTLVSKGSGSKGGKYLVCSKAVRGKGCPYRAWNYSDIEIYVLSVLREIDVAAVLSGVDVDGQLSQVRAELVSLASEIASAEAKLKKYEELMAESDDVLPKAVLKDIKVVEDIIDERRAKIKELEMEQVSLTVPREDGHSFSENLLKLYDEMDSASIQRKYIIRVRLRDRLSRIISRIDVRAISRRDPALIDNAPKQQKLWLRFRDGRGLLLMPIGKNKLHKVELAKVT